MIRELLDTNVLASAIAGAGNRTNIPGELFRRWRRDDYVLVTSDHILDELARTLCRSYFRTRISDAEIQQALRAFQEWSERVQISIDVVGVASHPKDDLILAAAASAHVDYLAGHRRSHAAEPGCFRRGDNPQSERFS